MTILDVADLAIVENESGDMYAGGFLIKSIFGKNKNPMTSYPQAGGDKNKPFEINSLLNNLAVPAGLLYLNTITQKNNVSHIDAEVAPDSLIQKLTELVIVNNRRVSRKRSMHGKNKTKKKR